MVWVPTRRRRPKVRARFAALSTAFSESLMKDHGLARSESLEEQPSLTTAVDPWTIHHIPPRHPKPYILKRVRESHHRAYHLIFGSSGSLQECMAILRAHWWPDSPPDRS
jgi:hypothetical protein